MGLSRREASRRRTAQKRHLLRGWIDPAGKRRCKSCGPGVRGKKAAERLKEKIQAELIEGTYHRSEGKVTWQRFREEYEKKILCGLSAAARPK